MTRRIRQTLPPQRSIKPSMTSRRMYLINLPGLSPLGNPTTMTLDRQYGSPLCLGTVAAIFPRNKAKAIGDAFVKFVGSEQTKPLKEVKTGLLFKIRKTRSIKHINSPLVTTTLN
ncbi:hypothetical protein DPMN_020253 [Dreissena polymorpha]|uniref:Uncharacterized protein n=1 Tax=Dreissena polymorpha TaxID=45954 RepID=A0A9D4NKP9_DREPO|nr:hypothetical protein DPMN_020253 [Dreissena polymorpha]